MRSLEEPDAARGRRLLWIVLAVAMLAGLVAWYATTRMSPQDSPAPKTTGPVQTDLPTSGNEPTPATERPGSGIGTRTAPPAGPPRRADRASSDKAPAPPAATARELRVTTDVPGAYVFLDRKFLGSTPLVSRDVVPGRYQMNVQIEGRPPVVRTVEVLADRPTTVDITLPPAARTAEATASIDAAVAVVHQHGVGSCEGTLRASGDGFRYDTPHKDAFTLPYASIETFTVDYAAKRLRLKQRGGRTWNFTTTADNADPLFVFHRDVEAARR
jgi:hypothetical protein